MKIELVPIGSIRPYENNPRKNDKAVEPVARSIKEFGWRQPIVVDAEGVIIIGHTRYKAALFLKLTEVPVHRAENLTPAQVRALRIADNKLSELADWDKDLLANELNLLDGEGGVDMTDLGFNDREIARLLDPESNDTTRQVEFVPDRYEVVVECADEAAQKAMYDRLTGEGFTCRVMTM